MVEVFGININECIEMGNINYLLEFISHTRAKKAMSFYNIKDSYRSVLGEIIARYAICNKSGCPNEKISFGIAPNGKPELKFPKEIFFKYISFWRLGLVRNIK